MPAPPIDDQRLLEVYRKVLAKHGLAPGINAVDIGFLYDGPRRTEQVGVRVHMGAVPPALWARSVRALPREIDGVPIVIVPATYRLHECVDPLTLHADGRRTDAVDPVRPGVSVSHKQVLEGTVGLIVYDAASGAPCVLSNKHILAGDAGKEGDVVVQPGAARAIPPNPFRIGTLLRTLSDEYGDAAVAKLNGKRSFHPAQWDTGVVITAARMPALGEVLVKSGVRTGVTCGRVDGVGRYFLRARESNQVVAVMDGFRIVATEDGNPHNREISGPGDSGSVWYGVDDHQGVGLHVAGETAPEPTQEHGIACYLPCVLDRLEVTLTPPQRLAPPEMEFLRVDTYAVAEAPAPEDSATLLLAESVARLARLLEHLLDQDRKG
jgi:endonuclease G